MVGQTVKQNFAIFSDLFLCPAGGSRPYTLSVYVPPARNPPGDRCCETCTARQVNSWRLKFGVLGVPATAFYILRSGFCLLEKIQSVLLGEHRYVANALSSSPTSLNLGASCETPIMSAGAVRTAVRTLWDWYVNVHVCLSAMF